MKSTSPGLGAGPGPITPDGSAVEFYTALPVEDEPKIVNSIVDLDGSILELGAGRVTNALTKSGYRVVAVDESRDMLRHVEAAETVCSKIEDLHLRRRFDCVILASYLIHVSDDAQRRSFVSVCREHVAQDGHVIFQRQLNSVFNSWKPSQLRSDDKVALLFKRLQDQTLS